MVGLERWKYNCKSKSNKKPFRKDVDNETKEGKKDQFVTIGCAKDYEEGLPEYEADFVESPDYIRNN